MTGSEIVITFLGTGSAIPPLSRQQSSIALRHGHGVVIFDCGEGTQYALRRNHISTRNQLVICISHLHSDHFLGLPGLLASFQLLNREDPIIIIGPSGLSKVVQNLINANFVKTTYQVSVIELEPKQHFSGKGYVIQAIKAIHEGNALSYIWKEDKRPGKIDIDKVKQLNIPDGHLIGKLQRGKSIELEGKTITSDMVQGPGRSGRSVCYSGDTSPNMELVAKLNFGCNVLIHDASYPSDLIDLAKERNHSTVSQAAVIASKSKVQDLILTHISPRIENIENELNIAKEIFPQTQIATDGLKFIIAFNSD